MIPRIFTLSLFFIWYLILTLSGSIQAQDPVIFLNCIQSNSSSHGFIYTPRNSAYTSTLISSIQNLRFADPSLRKPAFIATPWTESQVSAVVGCSRATGFQLRVRCGGHDYEGLSSTAPAPFGVLDLRNFVSIEVDDGNRFAWVGGGVLLGNLSYQLAQVSRNLAFPNGLCPTVGVGGHFSRGGYGVLLRKYGLSADNIADARIVDAGGRILDRESMGEDLFWAIRGGGAASFGVVTAWKIRLVPVPETVTVFTLTRTLDQNATALVHRWQYIAANLDRDLFIRVVVTRANSTVQAAFNSIFLGKSGRLLRLMRDSFPELGLRREDCLEKTWIDAVLYFSELPEGSTTEDLTRRDPNPLSYYKAKSDFVSDPIPVHALDRVWEFFKEEEAAAAQLILAPYGGRMSDIPATSIPFPHRGGIIYEIQHLVYWNETGNRKAERYVDWVRRVYGYVTPFVTANPRGAYVNYRDLDLGVNNKEGETSTSTSYEEASVWGIPYFRGNFMRLVRVKNRVDPGNFFRNEQSIPVAVAVAVVG